MNSWIYDGRWMNDSIVGWMDGWMDGWIGDKRWMKDGKVLGSASGQLFTDFDYSTHLINSHTPTYSTFYSLT